MRLSEKITLAKSELNLAAREYVQSLDYSHARTAVYETRLETAAIKYTILRQEQFAEENK